MDGGQEVIYVFDKACLQMVSAGGASQTSHIISNVCISLSHSSIPRVSLKMRISSPTSALYTGAAISRQFSAHGVRASQVLTSEPLTPGQSQLGPHPSTIAADTVALSSLSHGLQYVPLIGPSDAIDSTSSPNGGGGYASRRNVMMQNGTWMRCNSRNNAHSGLPCYNSFLHFSEWTHS